MRIFATAIAASAVIAAGAAVGSPASARTFVSVGIGGPAYGYGGYPGYYPGYYPAYYGGYYPVYRGGYGRYYYGRHYWHGGYGRGWRGGYHGDHYRWR